MNNTDFQWTHKASSGSYIITTAPMGELSTTGWRILRVATNIYYAIKYSSNQNSVIANSWNIGNIYIPGIRLGSSYDNYVQVVVEGLSVDAAGTSVCLPGISVISVGQ